MYFIPESARSKIGTRNISTWAVLLGREMDTRSLVFSSAGIPRISCGPHPSYSGKLDQASAMQGH